MIHPFSGLLRRTSMVVATAMAMAQLGAPPTATASPHSTTEAAARSEVHHHVTLLTGDEVEYTDAEIGRAHV